MSDKAKNILSYIIPICGIVFMLVKDSSREVKLVGAQATSLWAMYFIISFGYRLLPFYIPMFYTLLNAIYFVFEVIGIVKVCKEENLELPVVGKLAQSVFGKFIEG